MNASRPAPPKPTFVELFTPKLVTVLREGYGLAHFRADAIAGLTVAIVALPLSMAIAIASGASPAQGLYTAIIGGFIVSLLGGSRFQVGGPAGAFIVLVAATAQTHGMEGLLLATIMSGMILAVIGWLRLGTYIKFIPYPVTVGFTGGIAVIILASQFKDLLGLTLTGPEPGPLLDKLPVLFEHLGTMTPATLVLSLVTIAAIVVLKRIRPHWPGMLIAVTAASVAAALLQLPTATIGTEFGGIPNSLPLPALPDVTWAKVLAVFPNAVSLALLGSIESLLSAVVADGMTGRRHRANCELVAQGAANVASGLFGGICVTGTIARTATNVRAGAHGPVAGMMHAVFLLLFVLLAAPAARYIPLASLAGVLAVVAWNMVEKAAFSTLLRGSPGEAVVLLATFFLTIFVGLTEAIVIGFALGAVIFIHRMSNATGIATHVPIVDEDRADAAPEWRDPYDQTASANPIVVVYRITGAFFFGAAAAIGSVLDRIAWTHRSLIIDFAAVPFIDATAANTLESLLRNASRRQVQVIFTATTRDVRRELFAHGLKPPHVRYDRTLESALAKLQRSQAAETTASAVPEAETRSV